MKETLISYLVYHKYSPYREVKVVYNRAKLWVCKFQMARLYEVSIERIEREIAFICKKEEIDRETISFYLPIPQANIILHEECWEIQFVLKIGKRLNSPALSSFTNWTFGQMDLLS